MPGKSSAAEMPALDAFDQEFERERVAIARGPRRRSRLKLWVLIFVLLGAGVISALALAVAWPNGDGLLRFELQSAPMFQRTATRDDSEEIDRLRREVDTLKKEISELNEAQRKAGDTIAALQAAAEQDSQAAVPGGYWYSSLTALNFGITNQSPPRAAAPPPPTPPRRPATARPELRRDNGGNGAPLSLEPPQR